MYQPGFAVYITLDFSGTSNMTVTVRASEFLPGYGQALVIVTAPTARGQQQVVEVHAFFSGDPKHYAKLECSYNPTTCTSINDQMLVDTARLDGEQCIYDFLETLSGVRYEAWLSGFGFRFEDKDIVYVRSLHLRNILTSPVEQLLAKNTGNSELSSHLQTLLTLERVTSARKI
jgi:hypothetical protein